jgi:SAM-dependent methyltransferase
MPRYKRLAEYVPGPPGRLLDIGTADGHFLEVMRARGWDVAGVEPGGSRPEGDNRQLDIRYGPFPEVATGLPPESFDVITAWAVFEHLHDPTAAFHECARLLRPGGRLVVEVPNLASPAARTPLKEDLPRHLYFYEARTLRRFGEQAGLVMQRVHHTPELFGGSNRGVLRLLLLRALGRSTDEFFEMLYTPKRQRFRRWPVMAVAWTLTSLVERVVLSNLVVRALRISGEIVVEFTRAPAPVSAPGPAPDAMPAPPAAGPRSG